MITRRNLARLIATALLAPSMIGMGLGVPGLAGAQPREDPKDWPNVFISPFGQPFRAKEGAPYPVTAWFKQADKNADGKIDHAEFMADAATFFDALDVDKSGVLDSGEVQRYERRIAPEILGFRVNVAGGRSAPGLYGGRLWLTQMGGGGPAGGGVMGALPPDATEGSAPRIPHSIDESRNGASPFSFFDQPEPVTAADLEFNGYIKKKNFLRLADVHFKSLDRKELGYLTLDGLPKTHVQELLERSRKRR